MRKALCFIAALIALAWSAGIKAHSNEELATRVGAHGGRIQMTGAYHVELLVAGDQVQVWVTDHADRAQATEGAAATVMVVYPGETVTVPLSPAGENRLVGRDARVKAGKDARVSVVLTMKGQSPGQVRFVLSSDVAATATATAAKAKPAHAHH